MSGWYYKLFGAEFGPVTLDELVELAKSHSLSADDEIRFGEDGAWRRAGSIGQLMTHLPYQASQKATSAAANPQDSQSNQWSSDADFETTAVVEPPTVEDRWWCKILDNEVGPMTFDDLAEMAKNHTMSREDQVRFGEAGRWRRAGSIGPLMAHFPFQASERVITTGKKDSKGQIDVVDVDTPAQPQPEPAPVPVQTAPKASPPPAAPPPEPAPPSKSEERWWCLIQDREYGPVDLEKIMEWAESGRLHSYDYVRLGRKDYVQASEVPGLFPKRPEPAAKPVSSSPRSTERSFTPRPATDSAMSTLSDTQPAIAPAADRRSSTPAPPMSTSSATMSTFGGASGFGSSASIPTRPAAPIAPARSRSSGGGIDIAGMLTGPVGMGIGGVVVLGLLIYFVLPLVMGGGADVARFKSLQAAFKEIAPARKDGKDKAAAAEMDKAAKKVLSDLKGIKKQSPAQKKLKSLATKMQELAKEDLSKSNSKETDISSLLKQTGSLLGVK